MSKTKEFKIISDGSCDLSEEDIRINDLLVVPFYVSFKQDEYLREKVDVSIRDFYNQMVEKKGVYPKTSMPSTQDYLDIFLSLAKDDIDIICMCITTKFSGSYNSAMTAKNLCLDEYPNARIEIVDTMVNTVLQGLIVKETCRMKKDGLSYDEIILKIEEIKVTGKIFFTVNGLDYLHHGGRIGKLTAIIGSVIKINPLINLREGEIFSCGISLTRKRAVVKVRELVLEYLKKNEINTDDYIFAVGYGYDLEEGKIFRDKLSEMIGVDSSKISTEQIGATIAVHTGPYPLGVGLVKKYDR